MVHAVFTSGLPRGEAPLISKENKLLLVLSPLGSPGSGLTFPLEQVGLGSDFFHNFCGLELSCCFTVS